MPPPKKRKLPSLSESDIAEAEPYPDHSQPTPQQCRSVRDALLHLHGFPKQFESYRRIRRNNNHQSHSLNLNLNLKQEEESNDDDAAVAAVVVGETTTATTSVLDGLVSTLLSQNTTDANSTRAFQSLKSSFPTWQQVLDADPKSLENAIRCGGLAATKATRIKGILKSVKDKRGKICLEYLRGMPVDEVKAELSHFKGIGPKTVACVLMFHLQQEDFPVDTHVFRITKSLGWIPMKADREKAYLHLNKRIPDELKFDLNCLLVTHGKLCERCVKKRGNVADLGAHKVERMKKKRLEVQAREANGVGCCCLQPLIKSHGSNTAEFSWSSDPPWSYDPSRCRVPEFNGLWRISWGLQAVRLHSISSLSCPTRRRFFDI